MKNKKLKFQISNIQDLSLVVIFVAIIILFWGLDSNFLNLVNIKNNLLTIAVIGIISVPMTMLLISGGVDISVGAMMGFASSLCALFMSKNTDMVISVMLTLIICSLIGLINGLIVTKIKVNAFIETIAMLSILKGIGLVLTSQKGQTATFSGSIGIENKSFGFLGMGSVLGLPLQIIFLIIFFIIGYVVLNHTQFGRKIYASGASEKVAVLSGINVDRTRISLFVVTSFSAAFGGIILASQFMAGHPRIGTGFEMLILTAVILGGTAFTGGIGTIRGVLLGILIIGTLRYGMDIIGIGEYYKQMANGAILLIAVGLAQLKGRSILKS